MLSPEDPAQIREHEQTGGVAIVVWPADASDLDRLAAGHTPRLVVVEPGCEPPVAAECCQDWMWRTGTPHEFRIRLRQVALRALVHAKSHPHLDSAGLLHVALRSVPLTALEQRLVQTLLARFEERHSAADLLNAGWPDGNRPQAGLAARISVLRRRLEAVGLELWGSSRDGYVLRPATAPLPGPESDAKFFDAELDAKAWLNN